VPQAALFSGQGAQRLGMGRNFLGHRAMEDCFSQAREVLGYDLRRICCDGPEEELRRTEICQVALLTVGYGAFCVLRDFGFWKDLRLCAGLSLGEWAALAAAGVLSFLDTLRLVWQRAKLMQAACEAVDGTMLSLIGGDRRKIQKLCSECGVEISNYNAPDQVVISGKRNLVGEFQKKAGECGVRRVIPLAVAGAYHSSLMRPAQEEFARILAGVNFHQPQIPVLSNVTGRVLETAEESRKLAVAQITSPVRWDACMETAAEMGVDEFCECGAGRVLVGLAGKNCPSARALTADDALEAVNFH
jgi:[acyl-carrier-protein] S-malonyltransferase